jgi:hypothetical protein
VSLFVWGNLRIYTQRRPIDKAHVSVWSDTAQDVEDKSHAHGLPVYRTTARARPFLRHKLVSYTSNVHTISILTTSIEQNIILIMCAQDSF